MASFDVTSLFTNVPIDKTLNIVQQLLENDITLPKRTRFPVQSIMELLRVCLESTYFQVDTKFYQQKSGLAMGGVLSPLLSNIFMVDFETRAIQHFDMKPTVWLRYIDDIFCIWSHGLDNLQRFKTHINSLCDTIKVTLEVEQSGVLPFLDVLIKNNDGKLHTSVYRKPTNTGKYLNYKSNHANSVKFGLAYGLINRAKLLCSDQDSLSEELNKVKYELVNSGYPMHVINKAMNHVPKRKSDDKPLCTVTIPYLRGFSEKVRRINSKYGIRTTFKSENTLRQNLTKVKPPCEHASTKNVVYKIPCSCGSSYIGQTSRPLKVRLKEHSKNIEKREILKSGLCCHVLENNHSVDWEKVKILYKESNWKKRCLLESAAMKLEKSPLSMPSIDLNSLYTSVIKNNIHTSSLPPHTSRTHEN